MQSEKKYVFTKIEINATTKEVWSVLTDWNKLSDWSTSFQGISTERLVKGERSISYFNNPLSGKHFEFEHEITDYEEGIKFGWSGIIFGKTKDNHTYTLQGTPQGTTVFRQEDGFHSENIPHSIMIFLTKSILSSTYKKFNNELKTRVELLFPKS